MHGSHRLVEAAAGLRLFADEPVPDGDEASQAAVTAVRVGRAWCGSGAGSRPLEWCIDGHSVISV
ncbi:hypothetical protein ACPC27_32760 [Streptomyces cellulosae]